MNFNFNLDRASEEYFAVSEVLRERGVKADDPAGLSVSAEKIGRGVRIVGDGKAATLYYSDRSSLIRGAALLLRYAEKAPYDVTETPEFETLGTMVDCSRNAVMNPETVKKFCRITALLGFNMIQLYTEDTYEVAGEPYFGRLRGRYTAAELREIDDYAAKLGIEVVPCIQTLAHLNAIFKWPVYRGLKDCDDILNTADDRVYELIDRFFASMSENLRSRKINIGMDEAYMLGRGHYRDMMGPRDSSDVMLDHLKKIVAICNKYGYRPQMWSDMFFRMCTPSQTYYDPVCNVTEKVKSIIPPEISLIYWDYYSASREKYDRMFENHLKFNNPIVFAGGSSSWYGLVPLNRFSLNAAKSAMESARANHIKEIFVTMWGDDGAPCSQFSTLTTLVCYGENNWNGRTDDENLKEALKASAGVDFDALLDIEQIENIEDYADFGETVRNPSRWMFFQDVMTGMLDAHVPDGANAYFAAMRDRIDAMLHDGKTGQFSYLFESWAALCDALSLKAEAGKKIKKAYDEEDRATLSDIRDRLLPEIADRVEKLHQCLRTQWMKENKAIGFDVQDIRYGALKERLAAAALRIGDYLDGRIGAIEELQEERLPIAASETDGSYSDMLLYCNWKNAVTSNVI